MRANPRKIIRLRPSRHVTSLSLALAAVTLLLVGPVACRRSAEVDGAVARASSGAEAAPAAAPADTPPAQPSTPPPGGDTSAAAAGARDTGDATGAEAAGQKAAAETSAAPGAATPGAAPTRRATGDAANGWKQYEANCSRCHGQDALGSAIAPDLRESVKGALDQSAFVQTVKEGRAAKGMPAFSAQLDDKQIDDIYAYVVARGSGKLRPGRPES